MKRGIYTTFNSRIQDPCTTNKHSQLMTGISFELANTVVNTGAGILFVQYSMLMSPAGGKQGIATCSF